MLPVFHSIEADHRLIAHDGGRVAHTPRDGDPIARTEDGLPAIHDELEPSGEDGVDLVYAVRMFGKVRSRAVDVPADGIPFRLELAPECLLRQFAVGLRGPVSD